MINVAAAVRETLPPGTVVDGELVNSVIFFGKGGDIAANRGDLQMRPP